jgi:hypothetical protein
VIGTPVNFNGMTVRRRAVILKLNLSNSCDHKKSFFLLGHSVRNSNVHPVQGMMIQIIEYYNVVLTTIVVHDAESNDWQSSVPFFDNKKISTSVQYWAYTLQGLRADLSNILPDKLAKMALTIILKRSLDSLTIRYCQVSIHLH